MNSVRRITTGLILLILLLTGGVAHAAATPATQPATQPSEAQLDLLKITSGEQRLTLDQVLSPEFWRSVLSTLTLEIISLVPRVVVAFLFIVIFWGMYRGMRKLVVGGMAKANMDSSIRDMLGSLIKWAIMGFGLVIAFNQIGIQITALLTGVSIIGLAIGFAAQESLANFIAGIVIFWDKPFRIGDWIEIDGNFGQILRITFRSTRMLNGDGEVIVMPNTYMLANRLSNHSTNPINRVRIPMGIAYKESIDAARKVMLGLVANDPRICKEPAPAVVVVECAASSVNLELRFWIMDESIEKVIAFEYTERIKNALDAAGIQIPFPHLQLFLEQTPAIRELAGGNGFPPPGASNR